jgi:hypothetical protein
VAAVAVLFLSTPPSTTTTTYHLPAHPPGPSAVGSRSALSPVLLGLQREVAELQEQLLTTVTEKLALTQELERWEMDTAAMLHARQPALAFGGRAAAA